MILAKDLSFPCFEAQGTVVASSLKAECSHKALHLQWTKNQIKSTKLGLELLDSKTLELLRLPKLSRFSGLPNKRKRNLFLFFPPQPFTLPRCLQVFFQDLDSWNFKVQSRPQHDRNKCIVGHLKWLLNVTV